MGKSRGFWGRTVFEERLISRCCQAVVKVRGLRDGQVAGSLEKSGGDDGT